MGGCYQRDTYSTLTKETEKCSSTQKMLYFICFLIHYLIKNLLIVGLNITRTTNNLLHVLLLLLFLLGLLLERFPF